jgi:hypothetical protein
MDDELRLYEPLSQSPALFVATVGVAAAGLAGMVALSGALGAFALVYRSLGSFGVRRP